MDAIEGLVADCEALNVDGGAVWICPYTDFPIVRIRDGAQQVFTAPVEVMGVAGLIVSEKDKELLTKMRCFMWTGPRDFFDGPVGDTLERNLSQLDNRVAALYNEYRGQGETDPGDPTFIMFDEAGAGHWSPEMDRWFLEDPDDSKITMPEQLFNISSAVPLDDCEFNSKHLIATTDDSGDETPCTSCKLINDDGEGDGDSGLCGDCADIMTCSNCGTTTCEVTEDAPVDRLCDNCRAEAAELAESSRIATRAEDDDL